MLDYWGALGDGTNIDKHNPTFISCYSLGTDELNFKDIININPNPVTDYLTINLLKKVNDASVEIYNSIGGIIIKETISNTFSKTISTKNFPSGIYFVKLQMQDGNVVVKKIIKE